MALRWRWLIRYGIGWLGAIGLPLLLALAAPGCRAAPELTLRVVGGISSLYQYSNFEEPFWSRDLLRLSAGRYAAEIVPFDRAGVPGSEMLRLIQSGVLPFGTVLLSHVAAENPELGAPDLAGLNPDLATLRSRLAALRPGLKKVLQELYGIELLAVYTYSAQLIYCTNPFRELADLRGRRVRVASVTQADFIRGLGATPVLLRLSQTLANIENGNTECAITGARSGYTMGLDARARYLHALPITWGLSLFGVNQLRWKALPADLRTLLSRELGHLETAIWNDSQRETAEGLHVLLPSASDEALRQTLLQEQVLPAWRQRCNGRCGLTP